MAVLKRVGKSNKEINQREWRKQAGMWPMVLLDHVMLEVAGPGSGWRAFDPFGGCLWGKKSLRLFNTVGWFWISRESICLPVEDSKQ